MNTTTTILNHNQIGQKIKRMAYQIYEANSFENEIIIAGIQGNGIFFAKELVTCLQNISSLKIVLCEVYIDKKNPLSEVSTNISKDLYKNKSIVLVDDVLNSGTTLMYGVKFFLEVPIKRFKTAVLVNRNHKKYPVKADFKGISLSTSTKEHVEVSFNENSSKAFLM